VAKFRQFQASFVSGELSPSMHGRVDTNLYQKAAKNLENVYVRPQGGAVKREGLEYWDGTTTNQKGRLIPFEFNNLQTYVIVFTPGEFKVYRTDVPGTVQATVTSSPVSGLTASQINEMSFVQSADTLLLFHNDFQSIQITRTSHTSWTASNITFSNIPQFDYGSGAEDVISSSRGWPATGTFYKSRLWLGFVGERPQTILASKIGDFFNLDEGTGLDDEAINVTIDDDRVNQIKHLFPGRGLQVFTRGGEFSIRAGLNEAITPKNIATFLTKETLHGTSDAAPQSVDGATVFIEQQGAIVRQFVFNEVEQSFNAPNISITSQHILSNPVRMDIRRATNTEPSDYVYVVNDDGTVAVLNSLREQDLLAWSHFVTNGEFEDVAVSGRKAFFIVKRTINGNTVRYLESLNPDHFMDSSVLQTSGTATTSWSNLSHLNGKTVQIRGDDFILDDADVSSGSITSSDPVEKLEAGFFNAATVEPLPLFLAVQGQPFASQWKSVQQILIQLLESRNVVVDIDGRRTRPAFRNFGSGILDEPIENFSGWKQILGGGISRDTQVKITQEEPLEFHLLGYSYTLKV